MIATIVQKTWEVLIEALWCKYGLTMAWIYLSVQLSFDHKPYIKVTALTVKKKTITLLKIMSEKFNVTYNMIFKFWKLPSNWGILASNKTKMLLKILQLY